MQFKSPWSERSDLYADYSDEHFATHPASTDSYPERQIKVKQVLNIAKDPISGKDLPPEAIPNSAIRSRIGQDVNVESFAFKPTAGELLTQMNFFLDGFIEIIQRYQLDSNHYLTQIRSAFHFAFGSITPPGTYEEFFQQKRLDANEDVFKRLSLASNKEAAFNRLAGWKQLIHYSQEFMDTVHPTMKLKEIKINADGHVVLRMTIQEAEAFLRFRNDWQRLFSENYVRYSDPEKITTLACVLAVVDLSDLTEEARIGFMQDLNLLFSQVAQAIQNKVYHFDVMEFSESSNRMLQQQDMYGKLTISRGYVHLNEPALEDPTPVDSLQRLYRLQGHLHRLGLFGQPGVRPLLAICDVQNEVKAGQGMSCN